MNTVYIIVNVTDCNVVGVFSTLETAELYTVEKGINMDCVIYKREVKD